MKYFRTSRLRYALVVVSMVGLAGCEKQTSEQHLQEARQFVAENQLSAAVVALKNALQLDPRSAQARFELGRLYVLQKKYESAEKELNRALEYGYDASKVLPLLTEAYQQTGAYSAISKIGHEQKGLTSVQKAEIGYFKVVALVRLDKIDEARLLIEELAEIETSSVFKGLIAVYAHVLDKSYDQALTDVAALRAQSPQNAEVLKLLGQLKLTKNLPSEAAEVFKDYVQFYPEDKQMMFVLAKLLVDIGQIAESEVYVDKLLEVNDQNPLLNQLKAVALAAKKDFSNALKYAEIAISGGLKDNSLRLVAGYSAYQEQDYTSANRHLSLIASSLPDNHPGLKILAASQLQLGLTTEVGDILERIDNLTEQDAPLFSKASYELLRDGYEKDAKALIEKSTGISSTAEDLTRLGLLKLSINNLDGIVNLEEAVAQAPELESAQTTLATAYIATGEFDKALALANRWKESAPADIKPYMLAGDIFVKQKKFDLAQKEFEQALRIDSANPSTKLALVNLQLSQGEKQKAEQQLVALLNDNPDDIPALATFYLLKKQAGDVTDGISKIQNAQQSNPQNIGLRLLLARSLMVEQQYAEAITLLNVVKGQKDLPKGYWKVLGQSLIRTNQRQLAELHYDEWLALEPNDKEATIGKLLLLDSQNRFEKALNLTQGFLEKRDDVQIQLLNTHFLLMNGNYPEAKKAYDNLSSEAKSLPLVKGFLARLQLKDKKPDLALANAQIAYEAAPNNRNLVLVLFIYERLNQKEKGVALLEQHVAKQPNDMAAVMLLAERQIGADVTSAMKSYEVAIQQNPNNYVARNNLAYLYLQNGELKKAKEHATIAVQLRPKNVAALDTLAQVWAAEGKHEKALELYEQGVTDDIQNEEIYLNYIETLLASNKTLVASRKLKQRELKEPKSIARENELKSKYGL